MNAIKIPKMTTANIRGVIPTVGLIVALGLAVACGEPFNSYKESQEALTAFMLAASAEDLDTAVAQTISPKFRDRVEDLIYCDPDLFKDFASVRIVRSKFVGNRFQTQGSGPFSGRYWLEGYLSYESGMEVPFIAQFMDTKSGWKIVELQNADRFWGVPKGLNNEQRSYPGRTVALAADRRGNLFISATRSDGRLVISDGVYRVDATTGATTFYADSGTRGFPASLVVDQDGNLFIWDSQPRRIRIVEATTGTVTTISEELGGDLALDGHGNLYVATEALFRVDLDTGSWERVDQLRVGRFITVTNHGSLSYSDDSGSFKLDAPLYERARILTLARDGSTVVAFVGDHGTTDLAADDRGNLFIAQGEQARTGRPKSPGVLRVDARTGAITTIANKCSPAVHVAVDGGGNVFFSDEFHRIRRVDTTTGAVTTIPWHPESGGGEALPLVPTRAPATPMPTAMPTTAKGISAGYNHTSDVTTTRSSQLAARWWAPVPVGRDR